MRFLSKLVLFFLLLTLCACGQSGSAPETQKPDRFVMVDRNEYSFGQSGSAPETQRPDRFVMVDRNEYSFDEVIAHSNAALIGTFQDYRIDKGSIYYRFAVQEWLYGATEDREIELTSSIGSAYVIELDQVFPIGLTHWYEPGKTYYLVMERHSSIFRERDSYVEAAQLKLCVEDGVYENYGKPIELPEGVSLRQYILETYQKTHADVSVQDAAEDPLSGTMFSGADYIAVLRPVAVVNKVEDALGDPWSCEIERLLYGAEDALNTFEDGTIYLVLFRDQVEAGKPCIVGFSPVDKYSRIYLQASREALLTYSEENLSSTQALLKNMQQ